LIIHASDLPLGRGWSPHIWSIINGEDEIIVSLLEASKDFDTGRIWKKYIYKIEKYYLYKEIIDIVNKSHIDLINFAIQNCDKVRPINQDKNTTPTYLPKRGPNDSEILSDKTIAEQFNLLRICDEKRFPAFFKLHGKKFKISIDYYE
jgi:methionyl-tRNA formyltransferase